MMEIERALAATEVGPLSHPTRVYPSWKFSIVEVGYIRLRWERVGVRAYGLSVVLNPLTRFTLDDASHRQMQIDLSPSGRGERSPRVDRSDSERPHPGMSPTARKG